MNGGGEDPRIVTAQFAVAYVNYATLGRLSIGEQQIRDWARRGHIGRHGRADYGRTLYDLAEVMAYVRSRGL